MSEREVLEKRLSETGLSTASMTRLHDLRSVYPDSKGSYWCWDCGRKHWNHSMIGQFHAPKGDA